VSNYEFSYKNMTALPIDTDPSVQHHAGTWLTRNPKGFSGGGIVIYLLLIVVAFALLAPIAVFAQGIESVIAPGKLIEGHAKLENECKECHVKFDRKAQSTLCAGCHKEVAVDMKNKTGYHGTLKPQACNVCHTEHKGRTEKIASFDTKKFDHTQTDFLLKGKHEPLACVKCHEANKKYRDASQQCNGCHKKDDTHKGSLGPKCADCHTEKNWKEARFDHSTTKFALEGKHVDVKCTECHKLNKYKDTPKECYACHKKNDDSAKGHKGQYGQKCETCHGVKAWKPSIFHHDTDTKYVLRGKHITTTCISCHKGPLYKEKLSQDCYACHKKDDKHKESLGKDCSKCHTEKNWKESPKFDHDKSNFPLFGKHAKVECKECHKSNMFKEAPKECFSCHKKDDKHKANLGEKCGECHGETSWKDTKGRFKHELTKFVLRNAHAKPTVKCESCHKDLTSFRKTPLDCLSCHKKDDKHEGQEGTKCEKCHDDKSWKVPQFEHGFTRFPLLGKHAPLACAKCHTTGAKFKDAKIACVSCHLKDDKHKKTLGPDCGQCHNARTWKDWTFDHDTRTKFPLDGGHKGKACVLCHYNPIENRYVLSSSCFSCHVKDDIHESGFGRQCQECHVTSSFKTLKPKALPAAGAASAAASPASKSSR
jgi:hypothetical protein